MKTITFFLGAGFSKAAKYPLGEDLNKELKEFLINGTNSNEFSVSIANYLVNEYEEQYGKFDYERFYEFLLRYDDEHLEFFNEVDKNEPETEIIVTKEQKKKFEDYFRNHSGSRGQNILNIEREFNLKLYDIFSNPEKQEETSKYSAFVNFINSMEANGFLINIFSLNHDRLIENLFHKNGICFSDGFCRNEIQYEYINKNGSRNKLFSFRNNFNENLRLFKLHGSIDTYVIRPRDGSNLDFVKPEVDEQPYSLLEKYKIKDLKLDKNLDVNPMPSFLTGKDSKLWYCKNQVYFFEVFQRLKESAKDTDIMIFIGYSFSDRYIDDEYLKEVIKKENTHIIDLNFDSEFLQKHSGFNKINKAFENVSFKEYLSLLSK